MSKVIDLPRVQAALKKLDQIASDHPELCGGGGTWTEEAVAEMIRQTGGTPAKQRVAAYRQRLAERGYKREVFFVSPQGQAALMTLREHSPDKTRDQILEDALFAKLSLTTTPNRNASNDSPGDLFPRLESESAPVLTQADRDQQILELHRQGLSNYAVADKAGCSEATVRRTLKRYNPGV